MKYEFTNETKEINDTTLKQIKAVKDFNDVKKGQIGGWIEKESNLSHDGNCWVYDDAKVYDNVWVYDDAKVYDNARVYGNTRVYGDASIHGYARVYDNAWVYGNARVYDNAAVYGNARVYGNVKVHGDAKIHGKCKSELKHGHFIDVEIEDNDYVVHGPIGSRNAFITIVQKKNYICTGCFVGTKEVFLEQVKRTHGDNKHAKDYKRLIDFVFRES